MAVPDTDPCSSETFDGAGFASHPSITFDFKYQKKQVIYI
jgi:hypothetical protein